jgi:hypothetical protein
MDERRAGFFHAPTGTVERVVGRAAYSPKLQDATVAEKDLIREA